MSAQLDISFGVYHFLLMQRLQMENQQLRQELERRGVNPDLIVRGLAQARRRKPRKRAAV